MVRYEMNYTFISIKEAIRQIDMTVTANDNAGVIGYIIRECKLLDLPLYQIDQQSENTEQARQVNSIISKLFYEYLEERYPPKPKAQTITKDLSVLVSIPNPFITKYTKEPFEISEYFWQTDKFKQRTHDIFATTNTVAPITIIQPHQDTQGLYNQIQSLQQQLKEKDEQIQALTDQLQAQQVNVPIFDDNHEYFAPDLAHAVNLWLDIYGNGKKKDDSHTNLANQWIKANTQYDHHDSKYTRVESRIREITTPLQDYGKERLKEKQS